MKELFYKIINQKQNKILCIGKNYIDHVHEMGGNSAPTSPVIFSKPFCNIIREPENFKLYDYNKYIDSIPEEIKSNSRLLSIKNQVHEYELELGIEIGSKIKNFSSKKQNAYDYISRFFIGLDITNRTYQKIGKDEYTGWFYGKELNDVPISKFVNYSREIDLQNILLEFRLNGELKQKEFTSKMIFKIPEIVEYISYYMTLDEGDLIFTGTPRGVGQIKIGDVMNGRATYKDKLLIDMSFKVEEKLI